MQKVGFIGLGVMGLPMAKNLLKAGFSLTVYDTRSEAIQNLSRAGAQAAASSEEVARKSDVIVVMVAEGSQVKDVVFGETGIVKGAAPGTTIVIMSTIEPTVVKSVAESVHEKGLKVIDAPVYRGAPAAEAGTLGILVGGEEAVVDECRDILNAMGSDVFYCGQVGSGEVVKIVNNYILINSTLLLAEGVATGVKYGIQPDRLIELLKAGSANSWGLGYWSDMVMNRKFSPPLFNFNMALKDTGLALSTAKELKIPMPVGSACHQVFQIAGAGGRDKLDYTAAVTWLEEIAGIELGSSKPNA